MIKKKLKQRLKNENGFTLVEVMVVLMILGFLAAIAFPKFSTVIENSQTRADEASIQIIESALEVYHIEEGQYPIGISTFDDLITELNTEGYIRQAKIVSADKNYSFIYNSDDQRIEREEKAAQE